MNANTPLEDRLAEEAEVKRLRAVATELEARRAKLIETQNDAYGSRNVGFREGQIAELERVIKRLTAP